MAGCRLSFHFSIKPETASPGIIGICYENVGRITVIILIAS